mmetsp:Transcript_46466/g.104431  ORF Transcript_46466/g.104431 Transcript_46466/m.104431 type:complete len:259 (+) Transcript_46466:82-858(+)
MVIPFGGLMLQDVATPPVIKEVHSRRWWAFAAFLAVLCVFDIIAVDIFGAIFDAIMCGIVWYMLRHECQNMSQYCLLLFGLMCLIQAVFGIIALIGSVNGRRSEHTSAMPLAQNKMTYTTVVETHPFFDPAMGFRYNTQSAVRIATPVMMLAGTVLAYLSYSCFPTSAFGDDDGMGGTGGSEPLGGRLGGYGGYPQGGNQGGGYYGTNGNSGVRPFEGRGHVVGSGAPSQRTSDTAAGAPRPSGPRLFEGSGQRLGSN